MTAAVEFPLAPRPLALRWLSSLLWRIEHAFERARAESQAEDAKLRIFFVTAVFAAAFVTLGVAATRAALFAETGVGDAAISLPAGARADLVDRNGQLLAVDLPHYALFIDKKEIWDVEETRQRLGPLLPPAQRARLEKALTAKRRTQVINGLTFEEKAKIADMGLPGVTFETEARRSYPLGSTAAHLIGFAGEGGVGRSGVELALDKQIRGAAGGAPVALSIDLRVQAALEDEVKQAAKVQGVIGAVGIVTNVRTGEILGLVSYPDYDPNEIAYVTPDQMKNRAAAQVFEMGSMFKVFTTATGLDSGAATLTSTFDPRQPLQFGGQFIHDHEPESRILTLAEVFEHSSNIGTAKLAAQIGQDKFVKYFRSFGLFEAAPIELGESARPYPAHLFRPTYHWPDVTLATVSFGHGMAVSPLAVATAMGGILNGGEYVPLTVVKANPDKPVARRRIVSEHTSRIMLDLMRANAEHGTGSRAEAAAPGLRVGGKTGTAEKAIGGRYDRSKQVSSFAAVFPTDGPMTADRYFVLVLMDEPHGSADSSGGRTGGLVSAPPAGRVINRIAPFLGVQRASTAAPAKPIDPAVEALIGAEQ